MARWNSSDCRGCAAECPDAGEEERLVANDGTTRCAAELIALQLIAALVLGRHTVLREGSKKVSCVEHRVAKELKGITMEIVSARLGDDVHYGAGVLAVFRGVVARLHAEYLKCIRERERLVDVRVFIYVVATVQSVANHVLARAVGGKGDGT